MKIIIVVGRKGGVGKTTIVTNMAVAAEMAGHTVIVIDLDSQTSAAKWNDYREAETEKETLVVVATPPSRVKEILKKAEDAGATLAILDTAADAGGDIVEAAEIADMALIPCHAARIDLDAITSTVNVVRSANIPARIVFNDVPTRGEYRVEDAREAVKKFDIPCVPSHIMERVAFIDAFNAGLSVLEYEPSGKASQEIKDLYKYLSVEMGV